MSSGCPDIRAQTLAFGRRLTQKLPGLIILLTFIIGAGAGASARELRVCADPNNLPFSNERGEGFENQLSEMIARDLGTRVSYTWWAQRRGFLRNTLNAGACDLVIGVPVHLQRTDTTRPYYRSTYVFVSPRRRHLALASLDDPALRRLRV